MKRYNPDINIGLTDEEVDNRFKEGLNNINNIPLTKSIKQIIISNVFTLFNFLNIVLGVLVLLTGSLKNVAFLGVVICNTLISTIQEIRSKKITDKLSLISEAKVRVRRNGEDKFIDKEDVVLDDLVILKPGNQVVTDSIIIDGECEVNESCVTGESDNVHKSKGDMLLSGSFIVENRVVVKVIHVGSENYTSKITRDAKYIKEVNSELMRTLNNIIKFISIIIIPVGLLLFYNQYTLSGNSFNRAILNTVAALIGMIPDGLILLTSTVLAVSTVTLSSKNVLVQQLFCIETLARVDTLCLDKTGTLTVDHMEVSDILVLDKKSNVNKILEKIASSLDNDNSTIDAIKRKYSTSCEYNVKKKIPFSSLYKYSAIVDDKTYIIGAPSVLIKDKKILEKVDELSIKGRVIALVSSDDDIIDRKIPKNINVLALILISNKVKKSASKVLDYFRKQDVDVRIISGDSVNTVTEIAKEVGLKNINAIDLFDIKDEDVSKYVVDNNIYARVTPSQKKIIIETLQKNDHVVAMVGDGVNDVLALKTSDCSIAMASGSDAARNVSEIVLLNSDFDSLPFILGEGRKCINNIERSSSLFLTKTLYASLLAIIFIIINTSYPFEPVQLSLYNLVTIGIPSFILALEPNTDRIKKGKFLFRVLQKAIPTSIAVLFAIIVCINLGTWFNISKEEVSTISTYILVIIGFRNLYKVCYPFNKLRKILYISLIIFFILLTIILRNFFSLVSLNMTIIMYIFIISFVSLIIFNLVEYTYDKIYNKYLER